MRARHLQTSRGAQPDLRGCINSALQVLIPIPQDRSRMGRALFSERWWLRPAKNSLNLQKKKSEVMLVHKWSLIATLAVVIALPAADYGSMQ